MPDGDGGCRETEAGRGNVMGGGGEASGTFVAACSPCSYTQWDTSMIHLGLGNAQNLVRMVMVDILVPGFQRRDLGPPRW